MSQSFVDQAAYDSQPSNPMFPNGKMVVSIEDARKIESKLNNLIEVIECPEGYESMEEHYDAIIEQAKESKRYEADS